MNCSRCGCFAQAGEKRCNKCGEIFQARASVLLAESNSKRSYSERASALLGNTRYASFAERVYSGTFDATLLSVVETGLICGLNFAFPGDRSFSQVALHAGLPFLISFLYYPLLESSGWQGTVGKRTFGLIVTDTNNEKLSLSRAFFKQTLQAITGTILFATVFFLCASIAERTTWDTIALYAIGIFIANILYFALHCAIVFSKRKQSVFDKITGRLVYKRARIPIEGQLPEHYT